MIIRRQTLGKITISKLCAWLHALFLAALLCCSLGQISSADTSAEWRRFALPAAQAQKNGDLKTAMNLWTKALGPAQKLGLVHPWYSITLRNLINLHFLADDNLNLTTKLVNQDFDAIKPFGPSYPDKSFDLQYLGRIESINGHFAESLKRYEEAFAIGDHSPITKDSEMELLTLVQVPYVALHDEKKATEARSKLVHIVIHRYPGSLLKAMGETLELSGFIAQDGNRASLANRSYFYDAEIGLLTEVIDFRVHGVAADEYRCDALNRRAQCYFQKLNILGAAVDLRSAADTLFYDTNKGRMLQRIDCLSTAAAYFTYIAHDGEALPLLKDAIKLRVMNGCKTADEIRLLHTYKQSLAACYVNLHKPEEALAIYNAMLKEPLDQQTKSSLLATIASLYDTMGDRKSFLEYLNLCSKHTDTMAAGKAVIDRWTWLSDRYALIGCIAQADQCMAKALQMASRLYATKPDGLAKVRVTLGELWLDRRRLDDAAQCAREALAVCKTKQQLKDWDLRGRALSLLAQAETQRHRYAEAIKAWHDELDMADAEPSKHPFEFVNVPCLLCQLYEFQGDYAHANEFADQARDRGVTYGTGWYKNFRQLGLLYWATIASKEGRFDQSNQACRTIIQAQTYSDYILLARYVLARNLIAQRKFDEAAKEAQDAMDIHALRPEPYLHTISPNSIRMWKQLFAGLRARAIDLSGDHNQAQPIFAQLATDTYDMPGSYLPLFANCWCWRADNLRSLGLTKQADEASALAHKFYEAPGWNMFDARDQCDSPGKPK
jgi:tetratricopeptide (TPR) repeat protein